MNILGRSRSVQTAGSRAIVGGRAVSEGPVSRKVDEKTEELSSRDASRVQALKRIIHQFANPGQPDERQQKPKYGLDTADAGARRTDPVAGMRSLLKEILKDPELGDALKVHLSNALREMAQAPTQGADHTRHPESTQQQLFSADQYHKVIDQSPLLSPV